MRIPTWLKWCAGGIGSIALAGLSNGVWEVAMRPGLAWLLDVAVNTGTFGITALQDEIYQDIARGQTERAGMQLFLFLNTFIAILPLALLTLAIVERKIKRRIARLVPVQLLPGMTMPPPAHDPITPAPPKMLSVAAGLASVFLVCIYFYAYARTTYVNTSTTYLSQLQTIVAPFVPAEQRLELASQAAQIRNRADFQSLVAELRAIAKSHGASLPGSIYTP